MKPQTLHDIRKAVAGRALTQFPAESPPILTVCTDSRMMEPSSVFVAIKGDNFDGHQYLRDVAAGGAIAAIIQDTPSFSLPNVHLIQVPDTRVALGKLAAFVRNKMQARIIAVAGSNGKTSTKFLIDAALSSKLTGNASPKSFNNDIGVPLAIFPADPQQDYLVLEMGTNNPGEIQNLATMAAPDIAVITNCSAEHLLGLDDLLGVRRENSSIIEGLDPVRGILIVNGDDPDLLNAVSHFKGRIITFGLKPTNDLFATDIESSQSGVRFTLNGNDKQQFSIPLLGRHNAINALAAIAVGRRLGLTEEEIAAGLLDTKPADMRLQLQHINGISLLNDAYNANPASMKAGIETLASLSCTGRKIAILGDMLEMGRSSDRFHNELGALAAQCNFDALVCVGPQSQLTAQSAIAAGMAREKVSHFSNSVEAAREVPGWLAPHDLVLLKGSRGMRLETIAKAIAQIHTPNQFERAAS